MQYFISAGSTLAIDIQKIKMSLKKSLDKFLKNQNLPFFKINSTIVGQAGKEIIKIMHKEESLTSQKIINHLLQK